MKNVINRYSNILGYTVFKLFLWSVYVLVHRFLLGRGGWLGGPLLGVGPLGYIPSQAVGYPCTKLELKASYALSNQVGGPF